MTWLMSKGNSKRAEERKDHRKCYPQPVSHESEEKVNLDRVSCASARQKFPRPSLITVAVEPYRGINCSRKFSKSVIVPRAVRRPRAAPLRRAHRIPSPENTHALGPSRRDATQDHPSRSLARPRRSAFGNPCARLGSHDCCLLLRPPIPRHHSPSSLPSARLLATSSTLA